MRKVNNIVVVGVGQMGKGIAQICLMAGYNVTLLDIENEIIEIAVSYIENGLSMLETKGKLPEGLKIVDILSRMKKTTNFNEAVNDADLVIEAIVEKLDIKQKVCKEVLSILLTTVSLLPIHLVYG